MSNVSTKSWISTFILILITYWLTFIIKLDLILPILTKNNKTKSKIGKWKLETQLIKFVAVNADTINDCTYLFVLAAPPLSSTGTCPVDPPPYRRYDDDYYTPMEPVNTYQPRDPFIRQPSSQHPRGQFSRQQCPFTFSSSRDHVNRQTPSTWPPPY